MDLVLFIENCKSIIWLVISNGLWSCSYILAFWGVARQTPSGSPDTIIHKRLKNLSQLRTIEDLSLDMIIFSWFTHYSCTSSSSKPVRSISSTYPMLRTYSRKARWQKTYWSGIWMEKARCARMHSTAIIELIKSCSQCLHKVQNQIRLIDQINSGLLFCC